MGKGSFARQVGKKKCAVATGGCLSGHPHFLQGERLKGVCYYLRGWGSGVRSLRGKKLVVTDWNVVLHGVGLCW